MSLRLKTLLIIGITHLGLIALLYASSRSILLAGNVRLERKEVQRTVERAELALNNEANTFWQEAETLAFRSDIADYFSGRDIALAATTTFSPSMMTASRLNMVILIAASGRQIYAEGFDWRTGTASPLPNDIASYLPPQGTLGNPLVVQLDQVSGFLMLEDGLWLLAAPWIPPDQDQLSRLGTLIVGRRFDQEEMRRFAQSAQLTLDLFEGDAETLPARVAAAREQLGGGPKVVVDAINSSEVAGYGLIPDIFDAPSLIAQVTLPREVFQQGQSNMRYIMVALVSAGIVFSIIILLLLELMVLSPLAALSASVRRIARSGDASRRIAVAGRDELSRLGATVNTMLEALQQAQQERLTGEQRLRMVVANVPVILFALDLKGRIVLLEGQALGESDPADYIGKPIQALFGDAPSVENDVQRALEGEPLISVVEAGDKVFDLRYIPMKSGDTVESVIGVATDITERERAESAEHEQRMIAEALRDTANALTSTLDLNEVLERILTSVGQVVSHDAANIMLIDNGQVSVVRSLGYAERGLETWINSLQFPLTRIPRLQQVVANGHSDVIQDTREATGWLGFPELHWVRSSVSVPIRLEGQVMGLLNLDSATTGFFTQKHADWLQSFADQAALALHNARFYESERYERRLAEMLRKTAEAFASSIHIEDTLSLILDQLRQVVRYKRAAIMLVEQDMLRVAGASGFPAEEAGIGTTHHYADIPLFAEALRSKNPVVIEDTQHDPRWTILPGIDEFARSWIGVVLTAHDVAIGFLSISDDEPGAYTARDIEAVAAFAQQAALAIENARILTELEASLADLREAHTHLVRTTRLSAAGEIAAGVAHQINTPLTTVIAEAYLMGLNLEPTDPNYESANSIREAAMRAAMVVRRLLDLTRTHPYAMELLDINDSLESSIAVIRAQIGSHVSRLEVDLHPNLPPVKASSQHLEDIWINLLLNARDAVRTVKGGLIRVTTRPNDTRDSVVVTVQDNGVGIPADKLEHVFEPFFTTKEYGTGLGLSICHEVVTHHGGRIAVESVEGEGTTFTITLPAARETA